jgi:hypothetical protein
MTRYVFLVGAITSLVVAMASVSDGQVKKGQAAQSAKEFAPGQVKKP